ncbi:MAG: hypothetical protein ACYSWU_27250, partial [Planctomycetota bacterium]
SYGNAAPANGGPGTTSYGEIEDYEVEQAIPEAGSMIVWSLLFGLAWAGGAWRFFRRRRR